MIQVNQLNKVWKYSTQFKMKTLNYHIGDSPRYTNKGHNKAVDLVEINKDNPASTKYIIEFLRGNTCLIKNIEEYP